jgi:DNA repair exonuclease SbcCD nuclease subunit
MAMAPFARVAETGVPVFIVPGNHERARIPPHLWAAHPGIHIFDRPRTFLCALDGGTLALSGFPFARKIRHAFAGLLEATKHNQTEASAHLLCLHQTVEGAQVGAPTFTFRQGSDVVRGGDIPGRFAGVVSGHIHRAQVLTHDLKGQPLPAPVVYPGSVERTSFAERYERKSYMIVSVALSGSDRGRLVDVAAHPLPTRPMVAVRIVAGIPDREDLKGQVHQCLAGLDPNSVVRLRLEGPHALEALSVLSAPVLRELAPPTMNVSLTPSIVRPGKASG